MKEKYRIVTEDGTLKFPNAPSNADFWKKQNETIENILKIL